MNNFLKKFLTLAFLIILPVNSYADDDEKMISDYVNNFGNQIIEIASNKKFTLAQQKEKLINLIESEVDTDWVSKFVLAKYYRSANDVQKERFKILYKEFMINTYAPKFKGYNGEKFEVTGVSKQSSYFLAKCIFYPQNPPPVNLDFRIKKKADNSGFTILDVVVEGVSLIETQRSEFGSAIATNGMDKFLSDLEIRVKELKAQPLASATKKSKS